MEELVARLPDMSLGSDTDSDDGDENELVKKTAVFSRSFHLHSLGLESFASESGNADLQDKHDLVTSPQGKPCNRKETSKEDSHTQEPNSDSEIDWLKFKSDFTNLLQASETKLASGQIDERGIPLDLKQQLLVDAIVAVHSEQDMPQAEQGSPSTGCLEHNDRGHTRSLECSNSPSRMRKGILSLSALETIHETELDRVLEAMPDLTMCHAPASNQTASNQTASNQTASNQTASNQTANEAVTMDKPRPKLVWDKEDTDTLMGELEQLIRTKRDHRVQSSQTQLASTGSSWSPDKLVKEPVSGTIFLDLRSNQQAGSGIAEPKQHKDRIQSDEEDSDDPYSWIAVRKGVKCGLQAARSPGTLSTTTEPPLKGGVAPELPPKGCVAQPVNIPQSQTKKSAGKYNASPQRPLNCGSLETNTVASPKPFTASKSKGTGSDSVYSKLSEVLSYQPPNQESLTVGSSPHSLRGDCSKRRQRNNDSLTLSSSFSEGDTPNSDGSNGAKIEAQAETSCKPSVSPSASPTKGKKKKTKKAKKSRKGDKVEMASKGSGRVSQRKLARALVLERIRNDSLTTSSDEEHCLTASGTEGLFDSLSVSDIVLPCQESEEESLDTDKIKTRLQRIIMLKKPPAQFVTPATSPVFHEGASFGPPLLSTDPGRATDSLLVVALSEHGLVAPPNNCHGDTLELDLQTQLSFHLLFLTWLIFQANLDSSHKQTARSSSVRQPNKNQRLDDQECVSHRENVESSKVCPFRVTGLLQTVYDGQPSLLVGISIATHTREFGLKPEGDGSNPPTGSPSSDLNNNETVRAYLRDTPLSDLISAIVLEDRVRDLIPGEAMNQLKEVTSLSLDSVFNLQEDVTFLSTSVSFYWHSGYHSSCLPSNESIQSQSKIGTTVCTLSGRSLENPTLLFTTLHAVYINAFSLAGLRIIYTPTGDLGRSQDVTPAERSKGDSAVTVALAIRGPDVVYRWPDLVGPEDCDIAKITDSNYPVAKFETSKHDKATYSIRTPFPTMATVAEWFGGRACLKTGSVFGMSDPHTKHERRKRQRVRFSESESEDGLSSPALDMTFPPLVSNQPCLLAQPYSKIVLVVAPLFPPCLYGSVLSSCCRLGYDILGMKRMRLNSKRATCLQVPKLFMLNFTPSSTPPSPNVVEFVTHPLSTEHAQFAPPYPSMVLHLGMENALLHSIPLKQAVFADFMGVLESNPSLKEKVNIRLKESCPESFLHVFEMSQEASKVIGSFSLSTTVSSSFPSLHDDRQESDMLTDELCFVAIPQCGSISRLLDSLNKVYLTIPPKSPNNKETVPFSAPNLFSDDDRETLGGFELLGVKVVPQLNRFYAKRLYPLPPEDPHYQEVTQMLSDVPATLLLFRGMNCNKRLINMLKRLSAKSTKPTVYRSSVLESDLETIISKSYKEAFSLACVFFSDKELFADVHALGLSPFVPSSWLQDMSILQVLQLPPDALFSVTTVRMSDTRMVLKVLDKLSRSGFSFVGMVTTELHGGAIENHQCGLESSSSTEPGLVVCVKRVNAVWYLKHALSPFTDCHESGSCHPQHPLALSYSQTFPAAVSEILSKFPEGIHSGDTFITDNYKIPRVGDNSLGNIFLPNNCKSPSSSASPLMETTAFTLPPSLLVSESRSATVGFLEVLRFLFQAKFEIRGLKMISFSEDLAQLLLNVCDCAPQIDAASLCNGPSVVLIVQRDNAASCCHMIFKSTQGSYQGVSDSISTLLSEMIVPSNAKQAKDVLELFKTQA